MGIRGLTTFIAQKQELSFVPYQLHDCSMVIDGNSVAARLYVREFGTCKSSHCAFGGDYDEYARCVKRFFTLLGCCKVRAIVVFDGGMEPRKFSTRLGRMKKCIVTAGKITPCNSKLLECPLPLLMLQVFKWIAIRSGATITRCDFEADEEIAGLARALSCPLLSFDSDYYVHAVPCYIPFPTLATELTEEVVTVTSENGEAETVVRYLHCSAFSVDKFLSRSDIGDWRNKSRGTQHILQVEVLPLIAALLGNDYVKPKTFRHFLSQIPVPKSNCRNHRQRMILGLLEWLRVEESLETAINKILSHTKKGRREQLEKIIRDTVNVYVGCPSKLLDQLNLTSISPSTINCVDEKEKVDESKIQTIEIVNEDDANRPSDETKCFKSVEEEGFIPRETEDQSSTEEEEEMGTCESENEEKHDLDCVMDRQFADWDEKKQQLPGWFLERYRQCSLPPSFMDIIMQRTYPCSIQVEDQSRPHCHAISFPLLSAIVRLLTPTNESPLVCLTRVNRHAASLSLNPLPRNSSWPAPENLLCIPVCSRIQILLRSLNLIDDCEEKNRVRKCALESLPTDWRVLALSLAYWRQNSSLLKDDERFLISACFCVVVLRVIDVRAGPPSRKSRKVQKYKNRVCFTQSTHVSDVCFQDGSMLKNFRDLATNQECDNCEKVDVNISTNEQAPSLSQVTGNTENKSEIATKSVKELLQLVNSADCLMVCEADGKLTQLRQIDKDRDRMSFLYSRRRTHSFNVTTVHGFSELQSVLLHVGHLNSLLGDPFVSNAPHTSFSGTIAYNAYHEIHGISYSFPSKKSVWEVLLGRKAPSLEKLMDAFFRCVLILTWGADISEESAIQKKHRRRKRNKKSVVAEEGNSYATDDSDKAEIISFDPENKFSLLRLIEHDS